MDHTDLLTVGAGALGLACAPGANPGEPAAGFAIQTPAEHGLAALVNLFGIESPGLTASRRLAPRRRYTPAP
jgi:hypothetical protein